jgi:phenylacetate-CoA ligase
MPLIRYRTKDISRLTRVQCACGRTLITLEKITGRFERHADHFRSQRLPSQVESVIMEFPEVEPHYLLRVFKKGYLDALKLEVETEEASYARARTPWTAWPAPSAPVSSRFIGIHVPVAIAPYNSIPALKGRPGASSMSATNNQNISEV